MRGRCRAEGEADEVDGNESTGGKSHLIRLLLRKTQLPLKGKA